MNRASNILRTALVGHVSKRTKAFAGVIKGSMNDLPQPCGDFKVHYAAQQRKYTGQLIGGIAFFLFTIGFGYVNGCFFMNLTPEKPADKNDYSQ